MNEQLKKRLIGAIVLVALAAIFIPMLFNGGEETEMPTFGSNLPPKPDDQFQTIEVPLQLPAPQAIDSRPITSQEEADAYEAEAPASTPVVAPAPMPAEPEPLPAAVEPPPRPAPPSVKPSAPKAPPVQASGVKPESGWVVQLGSFGSSANALALRDKARKKGYAAFVEQQKAASGAVYRVRIGPELKRENADLLKAKLEKNGFNGVVMPHP